MSVSQHPLSLKCSSDTTSAIFIKSHFLQKSINNSMSFKSIFQGQQQQLLEVGGADSEVDSMSGLGKCSRSHLSSPCHNYYSDEDLDLFPPSGKRLAPVGAASNEDEPMASASPNPLMSQSLISNSNELEERLKQMEEDQEEMNSNLIALTSHFAKVCNLF